MVNLARSQAAQKEQVGLIDIGIQDKNREAVIAILNENLSDEYLLYTKTLNFHWNVTGLDFGALHKFFESHYEALLEMVDEVAERVRALGGNALGTMTEFLKRSSLQENPGVYSPAEKMISDLLSDHEQIIQKLRKDIVDCDEKHHDIGTNNFLTDLMEKHEKMAWMLRAHLE